MAEKIYTIPINDAFDMHDGCPLCRLHDRLETQSLEYIMGAAMMEPDVRAETNRLGFCEVHFGEMLEMKNRLSLALILESRLNTVAQQLPRPDVELGKLSKLKKNDTDRSAETVLGISESCYVCSRVEGFERQYLSNVVYIWKTEPEFRQKLKDQPYFCLNHYGKLLSYGKKELSEAAFLQLAEALFEVESKYLESLSNDVTAFCRSFDHQSAKTPLTERQKTSVQRAGEILSCTKHK